MSVFIRTRRTGHDPVARSHRRAARMRTVLAVALLMAVAGGGTWLMFSSSVFAVTEVRVTGATAGVADALQRSVEDVLGQRTLGFLRPARNILLLDEEAVAASLYAAFANVGTVEVTKEYPHTLSIAATERTPVGTWCAGDACRYFDATGARWGEAVQSRGPLLLLVRDERAGAPADPKLFAGLMTAVGGLPDSGMRPITATLPDAAPGDLIIRVDRGYDIIMDALGDVPDQLGTLQVYIADKATDPSFIPVYIDTRTPGRVYVR